MFTTPLDHIATPERLMDAALSIKSKAVGIDGESLRRYREEPALLEELSAELVDGRYTPVPMQRIDLPKSDGETRPIALASVRDKIVQKLLAQALTPYFDHGPRRERLGGLLGGAGDRRRRQAPLPRARHPGSRRPDQQCANHRTE